MRSAPTGSARPPAAPSARDHLLISQGRRSDLHSPVAAVADASGATAARISSAGPGVTVTPAVPVAALAAPSQITLGRARDDAQLRYLRVKRWLDVVVASILLILVGPLLLVIAIAITLDTRGPVLFRQERVRGRQRSEGEEWALEPFRLYKFRTMVADADPSLHRRYIEAYIARDERVLAELRPGRACGDSYRPLRDPRVTRVGAVLRKLSLDELPQLWNVARGDMSLVGPRPPLPYEVAMYGARDLQRLTTPQGITGLAQVRGRCAIGFDDLIRHDLEYVSTQSLWLDLKVLAMTVPIVLSRRGAD
jgi:lipopolysaccharide/colanic/teichoic acid biosynthesis glycosyltransferase